MNFQQSPSRQVKCGLIFLLKYLKGNPIWGYEMVKNFEERHLNNTKGIFIILYDPFVIFVFVTKQATLSFFSVADFFTLF